jgi:uncharacterized delta-60 repeat protein
MKTSSGRRLGLALAAALAITNPLGAGVVLDPNFHAPFFATPDLSGRVRLLPNGKFVVFFNTDTLTDQPTGAITRYLADGTLDTSFNFSQDYDGVTAATPLANGQLLIAASQSVYGNSDGTQHVLRLNPDGSIDPSFNPNAITSGNANSAASDNTAEGTVREIALQPDGRILVAGFFESFQNITYPGIVRLLANGTIDPSFAAVTLQFSVDTSLGPWMKPVIQQMERFSLPAISPA